MNLPPCPLEGATFAVNIQSGLLAVGVSDPDGVTIATGIMQIGDGPVTYKVSDAGWVRLSFDRQEALLAWLQDTTRALSRELSRRVTRWAALERIDLQLLDQLGVTVTPDAE